MSNNNNNDEIGKLFIKIISAKNTLALDITGTSDPYCLLSLISTVQTGFTTNSPVYKTEIVSRTLNPVWKYEKFTFDIFQPSQEIYLEMWDEDKISADDFMGLIKVDLKDLKSTGELNLPMIGKKAKSKKKRGTIQLKYQFYTVKDLVSILVHKDLTIIKSFAKILHSDEFSKSLMFILANHGNLIETIKEVISIEIDSTESANVLFRTDSLSTKLTVSTFKIIGFNYLQSVILPIVNNIIKDNVSLEVDPTKCGGGEIESEANLKSLTELCTLFIDAILASIDQLPNEMKQILQHISIEVEKKFGDIEKNSNIKSIGGFFFLRFINPSIFSPDALGLIRDSPNPTTRRVLTLVPKLIQNISNQVIFTKEPYLIKSNPYISSKFDDVLKILQQVSTPKSTTIADNELFQSLFQCDPTTMLKYSDEIYQSILDKKQMIDAKIKSISKTPATETYKLIDELDKRCHLVEVQKAQESKRYQLKQ